VFFENLRKKVSILFVLLMEKASIYPLLALDKNFGMGKDHPVAWCKNIGKGKTFYTSMGHDETTWKDKNFAKLIENGIVWRLR
jgi:type 1 glutamine amidotransferase